MKVLAGGTAMQIEPFEAAAAASPAKRAAIHNLIVQSAAPWFSEIERRHLEGALSGEFGEVARDRFWIARIGAEPVANFCFNSQGRAIDGRQNLPRDFRR